MRKHNWESTNLGWALAIAILSIVLMNQSTHAQTYQVIYNFTGRLDGANPAAALTLNSGNFYGTTAAGGAAGDGTVFELKPSGTGWVLNPLYNFAGGDDGAGPLSPVIFGPDGTLYGTTTAGGGSNNPDCEDNFGPGCGTVFNLRPQPTSCKTAICFWNETVLYRFPGGSDGGLPPNGSLPDGALVFDHTGNIYGTASGGSIAGCFASGCGVVYELTPSGGSWTQSVLYSFQGNDQGPDGGVPHGGVIFDHPGNLYGTTYTGGSGGLGTVFQLTPSGSGWMENKLYSFLGGTDGGGPDAGVIFDDSGNLYGSTIYAGTGGAGTAFELSNGSWGFTLLYGFVGANECGPHSSLVMDQAGNLYGTTICGGVYDDGLGSVFKLTPVSGGWMYTDLYTFTGGSDGKNPIGGLVIDASSGNLYGTAADGGAYGYGVIFKITPN